MKKTNLVFCSLCIIFSITSCSVSVDVNPSDSPLIGTWNASSFDATIETSTNANDSAIVEVEGSGFVAGYELTFRETGFSTNGQYNISAVRTVNGSTQTSQDAYMDIEMNGIYTIDEDAGTITIDKFLFEFSIDEIDLESLNEEQNMDYEINQNGNLILTQNQTIETFASGITTTSIITSRSVWVK